MELQDNQYFLYKEKIKGRIGWYYAITSNEIKQGKEISGMGVVKNDFGRIVSSNLVHLILRTDIPTQENVEIFVDSNHYKEIIRKGIGERRHTYAEKGLCKKDVEKLEQILKEKNINYKILSIR